MTVAPKVYKTEEAAMRRQQQLLAAGLWPGVRRCEGGWVLTVDPDADRPHRATGAGE